MPCHISHLGPIPEPCRRCYIGDAQPIVLVTKATKCGVRMITNHLTVSPGLLGLGTAIWEDRQPRWWISSEHVTTGPGN